MKVLKLCFKWIKGNRLSLFIGIVILILLDYIRSLVPVFISEVYAILDPANHESTMPKFLLGIFDNKPLKQEIIIVSIMIISIIVLRDILNVIYDYQMNKSSEGIGDRLRVKFYDHVQKLPFSVLSSNQTGDLIQRSTSDIDRFKRFVGRVLPNMLNNAILIGFYYYQMIKVDFWYATVSIIAAPILIVFSFLFYRNLRDEFEELEEIESEYISTCQESLTNIRVVKAFNNEKHETEKYKNKMDKYVNSWRKTLKKTSFYWGITDTLLYLQIIISIFISVYFYKRGVPLSGVLLVFACIQDVLWRSRALGRQLNELNKTTISVERIEEILTQDDEYKNELGNITSPITGKIEFKNVSYSYSDSVNPVLENISFNVNPGETIAIIGKTGSGKTTLVNLINRLLDCTSGEILIDNIPIKDYDKKHLRKNVGFCMQEPFLYSNTIYNNIGILLDNKEENKDKIYEVAKISSIDQDILEFTNGYDTIVGERGVTLSGGQKQRIAISRILTESKPILVFDDSLSAVDTNTDKSIRHMLNNRKNKSTTFIITHKIMSAKDADKIIIINDGKIQNIGKHEELLQIDELYKSIYNIQNAFNDVE